MQQVLTLVMLLSCLPISPRQVREAIDRFITAYNQTATPFQWTKREIRNVHPHLSYANLRN